MYKGKPVTVIIAAGGMGTRFSAEGPKQFSEVGGRSMVAMAAEPFLRDMSTDEIIFVTPEDYIEHACSLIAREFGATLLPASGGGRKLRVFSGGREILLHIVCGGDDRAASVRAGLEAAEASVVPDGLVLIHDAARPFVTGELIGRVLEAAFTQGAAVPAIPVRDTIYVVNEEGFAVSVPGRDGLRAVQTPQGFAFSMISGAHKYALANGLKVTDDGMPALAAGVRVAMVEGDPDNIKITTREDLRSLSRLTPGGGLRVGVGFDAHRFCDGRPLVLGGIEIPFEKGLAGHSDADVLTHSLMDAILGALREGDIGMLFPDTDPAYAGVSSMALLEKVVALMRERGYDIVNADMTLVAERPRMAPYREAVERSLAAALDTAPENVSLKATTTEKLGFTGREEGIAAEAVVLLRKDGEGR